MRLACRTLHDHAEPTGRLSRVGFLRTRALAVYAYDELPGFVLADKAQMLALAAGVGCAAVLAELYNNQGVAGAGSPS
jgi:hypothetical protein